MRQTLDARGLLCPLPTLRARVALGRLDAGDELIVLATDPEAPLDLAALASDGGHAFTQARRGAAFELRIVKRGV